jgi:hypothetical protein
VTNRLRSGRGELLGATRQIATHAPAAAFQNGSAQTRSAAAGPEETSITKFLLLTLKMESGTADRYECKRKRAEPRAATRQTRIGPLALILETRSLSKRR